jgi:DDE superfamily endonuclease
MNLRFEILRQNLILFYTGILFICEFIQESMYIPRGVRTMYTDNTRGIVLTGQLLHGHPERIKNFTRLKRHTFFALLEWLLANTNLKDSREVSAAEKLIIFLHICSQGIKFRIAAESLQHSTRTIHRAFYQVLAGLLRLHKEIVVLPPSCTPDAIEQNDKYWPYFCDCLGALDGTHIEAWIPSSKHGRWRNRKGQLSQNVLGVCNFDMNFLYVLPGWEGSAHDSRVLADATMRGFSALPGKYYLGDAGYSNSGHTLAPYQKVRYHLREQARAAEKPKNPKELFNLRHASLRNVVERTFGVLKGRFVILQKAPRQYIIRTQIKLVYALTALHNFMNTHGHDPESEIAVVDEEDPEEQGDNDVSETEVDTGMSARRDEIADLMWRDYVSYWS